MKLKPILFVIFTLVIINLVSSCGFRLKGQYYLPDTLQTLYLSSEQKFSPLEQQVKIRLLQNQVQVVDSASQNISELRVLRETFQRRRKQRHSRNSPDRR